MSLAHQPFGRNCRPLLTGMACFALATRTTSSRDSMPPSRRPRPHTSPVRPRGRRLRCGGVRLALVTAVLAGLCACTVNVKVPPRSSASPVDPIGGGLYEPGVGGTASFDRAMGVAVDTSGQVYVADVGNEWIRKITPAGAVSTLAGSGVSGSRDGTGDHASFDFPTGVAVDAGGQVYVADAVNSRIRKITPAGVVSTLAGSGVRGSRDGTGTDASFDFPTGVAVDAIGHVYVADGMNNRIRKITPAGVVSTLAGSGVRGSRDGTGTVASFHFPTGVAVDAGGLVYVADAANNQIRKISLAGTVSTLAGSGLSGARDGTGADASFDYPSSVAVDSTGNVYVSDHLNHRIRKITPAGVVSTLAGSGNGCFSDGVGADASFQFPSGVAIDSSGHVYVADEHNYRIRKIDPAGVVSTLAGSGRGRFSDGSGADASLGCPE